MRPFALSASLVVVSSTVAMAQTTADIQRELRQRDAVIQQLQRRIEALEQQQQRQQPPPPPQAQAQPQPPPQQQPRVAAPARPGAAPPAPAAAAESDETVARALERSLVEQGGSLL